MTRDGLRIKSKCSFLLYDFHLNRFLYIFIEYLPRVKLLSVQFDIWRRRHGMVEK